MHWQPSRFGNVQAIGENGSAHDFMHAGMLLLYIIPSPHVFAEKQMNNTTGTHYTFNDLHHDTVCSDKTWDDKCILAGKVTEKMKSMEVFH